MKTETIETYDWQEDVEPALLDNLNKLLVAKGIEPLDQLQGGRFKDGKWVEYDVESKDYRNYWHAYLELWGEHLRNDSYQETWFDEPDDDDGWENCKEILRNWSKSQYNYVYADPNWTDDLVDAMRKVVTEHFPVNSKWGGCRVVFWWSW